MEIVEFNGIGVPLHQGVEDGDVLILYKPNESIEVVKLKILPPDDFGPELTHAKNIAEFKIELMNLLLQTHPKLRESDRDWVLTCPPEYVQRAIF